MVTAYPVAGKQKSLDLCVAFIRGCGGQIASRYRPGPAVFYGVDHSNEDCWRQARLAGDDIYYIDNSYFDAMRQRSFRVTKNRLQHSGAGVSDGRRFAALGIRVAPWRGQGGHVVVCQQSDLFMRRIAGFDGNWTASVVRRLQAATSREIRVRPWSRNKIRIGATLGADLAGAHAVVVWSSAAAVAALIAGIPVVVESEDCAARCMAGSVAQIEALPMPDRENWLGVLADNEWTIPELTDGTACSHLTR